MPDFYAFVFTYRRSNTQAFNAFSKYDPLQLVNNAYHFFFF